LYYLHDLLSGTPSQSQFDIAIGQKVHQMLFVKIPSHPISLTNASGY